jgi:hypothetical protein
VAFANGIRNISLRQGRIHLRGNTAIIIELEFAELRLANERGRLDGFGRNPSRLILREQLRR